MYSSPYQVIKSIGAYSMGRYRRERGYFERLLHRFQSPAAIFDHELWRLGGIYYREIGIFGVTKYWQSSRAGWVVRVTTSHATESSVKAVAHLVNEKYAKKNAEALHYASGFGGTPDNSEESIQRVLYTFEDIENFLLDVREKYIDSSVTKSTPSLESVQKKTTETFQSQLPSINDTPLDRPEFRKVLGHLYCQKCGEHDLPSNFLESEMGENFRKCPKCFSHFQALKHFPKNPNVSLRQIICPKCSRAGENSSFFDSEAGKNYKKCPNCSMNFQVN